MSAQLHVFLGAGGVGKTTVSAAWALSKARGGSRVALITIDPAKRLAQALGLETLSPSLTQTPISENLWAMMLEQEASARHIVTEFATQEKQERLLKNRYFQVFSRALSGVQEMMAIYEVHRALMCGRFDLVVLDTPPAQHALDLFEVPNKLRLALESPALRWLNQDERGRSAGALSGWRSRVGDVGRGVAMRVMSRVTSSAFIEDLFEFLRLFAEVLSQLKDQGGALDELTRSERAHLWIVARPHETVIETAREIHQALRERGYSVSGWILNRTPLMLRELERELRRREESDAGDDTRYVILDVWRDEINALLDRIESAGYAESAKLIDPVRTLWRGELQETHRGLRALSRVSSESPAEFRVMLVEEVVFTEIARSLSPLDRVYAIANQLDEVMTER